MSQNNQNSNINSNSKQLSLFSTSEDRSLTRWPSSERSSPAFQITQSALESWKNRVYAFQRQVYSEPIPQQQTLLTEEISYSQKTIDPQRLDPFQLRSQNIDFWRWKVADSGEASLYFVIDYTLPLLLYVGETIKSNQRWKGEHDCKRYLSHYRQAHYQHQLHTQIGIAFLRGAPTHYKARQGLELNLIKRWRSPFNKENWEQWATPFVGGNGGK
jgi:hypothetical protein